MKPKFLPGAFFAAALLVPSVLSIEAASAATPPNVLIVAQSIDDIVSLDPAEGFELTTVQSFNSLYQRLVESNPTKPTELDPVLAESFEKGADNQSLTFAIRKDAKFASGNPVRPEDVIFSLGRAVKMGKTPVFILEQLGWGAATIDQFLTKVDDSHVKVSWPAKVGPSFALSILSAPVASIVDEKTVSAHITNNDFGNAWLHNASAGSGPYQLKAYTPGEALVFVINPTAPGGAPKIGSIIFKDVPDPAARRLLIEQGDADITRDLGADQVAALKGKPGVTVLSAPSAETDYLAFNAASSNPVTKNPALWEAARWLIDYKGIAEGLLKGQYTVHQTFLPSGFPGALDDNPFTLDVAKAKDILSKGGIPDGTTIKLSVINQPPFPDIAQAIQASFAQAGIKLVIDPKIGSEFYAQYRARSHEAALLFWIPDYFDAHSNASTFAFNPDDKAGTVAWRNGWVIPELSAKTQSAVEATDPAERAKIYGDLQKEVQTKSPILFLFQASSQIVLRSNVKGFVQGLDADQVYFQNVTK
ncbi:MAG: dipeptide-binding transporter, periplasmic substrate-binding component [Hyphomicrobiales bacterium]|nr:dipeptide-binding transporter, periplasmic substrate-binding component [Hyphomicrobiales bacterium]